MTEIKKGVFVLSRAKKKFDNILTNAKAGTPYPKNFNFNNNNVFYFGSSVK